MDIKKFAHLKWCKQENNTRKTPKNSLFMDPYFTTRHTGDPARSMKLPLYCYWKFHCCSAINRLSFNMFLLITRKCMSESVHFYHTSSILMSFWYIVLKNLSFLRGCKSRFIQRVREREIMSNLLNGCHKRRSPPK